MISNDSGPERRPGRLGESISSPEQMAGLRPSAAELMNRSAPGLRSVPLRSLPLLLLLAGSVSAQAETIYVSWANPGPNPVSVTFSTFDSATPWLPEVPVANALVPDGSLDFDPVTRQLWSFYYFPCLTLCPPPRDPINVDPLTGSWSFVDLPGFQQPLEQDFDIDPLTRELRYFGTDGENFRYSLERLEAFVDTPLSLPVRPLAVAHKPPIGGIGGVETYIIYWDAPQGTEGGWFSLARVGGPNGAPPASSGELQVIGRIDLQAERLWFDISENGTAFLAALTWPEPQLNKFYRVDLGTGALEEIGEIAPPSKDGWFFLSGIAVAPSGLGNGVLAIPALSPLGAALFALVLALAALFGPFRRRNAHRS